MEPQDNDTTATGSEQVALSVLDSLPEKTAVIDQAGDIIAVNTAWRSEAGHAEAMTTPVEGNFLTALRLTGLPWAHDALLGVEAVLAGRLDNFELDFEFTETHGGRSHLRSHAIHVVPLRRAAGGAVISQVDITWRKGLERELSHRATHDGLTNLPNRLLLKDRLTQALARAARSDSQLAVLFCDLDSFKDINDTLGHAVGDQVLVLVADRLKACCGKSDWVTRFGGDEFVVVAEDIPDPAAAAQIATRIRQAITAPIVIEGDELFFGMSIGVAVTARSPDVGPHAADDLIRDADTAMYRAKDSGRNRIEVFDAAMRERLTRRISLVHDLRRALKGDELFIEFQPQLRIEPGSGSPTDAREGEDGADDQIPVLMGAEALVRWRHPTRGLVGPTEFIATAEGIGIIGEITEWVTQRSLEWLARWMPWVPAGFWMSINISPLQLADPLLPDRVAAGMRAHEVDPHQVCLEITEGGLMDNPDAALDTLGRLRRLGLRIAIDDFGTGHSSLAYLNRFPLDVLKIDGSFVTAIDQNLRAEALVRGIVDLAEAMGLITIAEGVETASQLACLRRTGVAGYQGFLTARPLAPEAMTDFLKEHQRSS